MDTALILRVNLSRENTEALVTSSGYALTKRIAMVRGDTFPVKVFFYEDVGGVQTNVDPGTGYTVSLGIKTTASLSEAGGGDMLFYATGLTRQTSGSPADTFWYEGTLSVTGAAVDTALSGVASVACTLDVQLDSTGSALTKARYTNLTLEQEAYEAPVLATGTLVTNGATPLTTSEIDTGTTLPYRLTVACPATTGPDDFLLYVACADTTGQAVGLLPSGSPSVTQFVATLGYSSGAAVKTFSCVLTHRFLALQVRECVTTGDTFTYTVTRL